MSTHRYFPAIGLLLLSACATHTVQKVFAGPDDGSLHLYELRNAFLADGAHVRLQFTAPGESIELCLPQTPQPARASDSICERPASITRPLDILRSGDLLPQLGIFITTHRYTGFGMLDEGGGSYTFLEFPASSPPIKAVAQVLRFPVNTQAAPDKAWVHPSPIFLVGSQGEILQIEFDATLKSEPRTPNRSLAWHRVAQLPPGLINQDFRRFAEPRFIEIKTGLRETRKLYVLSDPQARPGGSSNPRFFSVANPQSDSDRRKRTAASCLSGPALILDILLLPWTIIYCKFISDQKCLPM